jgi:hypothetical protein
LSRVCIKAQGEYTKGSKQSIKKSTFSHLLLLYLVLSCSARLCCFEEKSIWVCLMRQGLTPFHIRLHVFVRTHSLLTQEVWHGQGQDHRDSVGTNGDLNLDMGGKLVDQKVYRSMIGSFLYLCASRPDIMLSMCMCARFQASPKECHLRAVKRIMRY